MDTMTHVMFHADGPPARAGAGTIFVGPYAIHPEDRADAWRWARAPKSPGWVVWFVISPRSR